MFRFIDRLFWSLVVLAALLSYASPLYRQEERPSFPIEPPAQSGSR